MSFNYAQQPNRLDSDARDEMLNGYSSRIVSFADVMRKMACDSTLTGSFDGALRMQVARMCELALAGCHAHSALANYRRPSDSNDRPVALFYLDYQTHKANKIMSIGGAGRLLGQGICFDPRDPSQGVFLIESETGIALRAETADLIEPASISITLPVGLIAGKTYLLEVRTAFEGCGRLAYPLIAHSASS